MTHDLVIGLGNPLRGDDGVGGWLAERAGQLRPVPRVLVVQQLTPELADELARAGRVLFIDAWWPPQQGTSKHHVQQPAEARLHRLQPLPWKTPQAMSGTFSHQLDPAQLLAITILLHGRAPEAWQLLVPAFAMAHGEGFSPPLQQVLPGAEALLGRWCHGGSQPTAIHA
jgi:hydrogenase maturation protease